MDYTNPFDAFKALVIVKDNVTRLSVTKKGDRTFKNRLGGIGDILQGVVHEEMHEVAVTETKEIVEVVASSDQLTSLVTKALEVQAEILNLAVEPTDENYIPVLRIKAGVCREILSTQTKVDENVLRARNDSRLGDILEKIAEAKKELTLSVDFS